MGAAGKVNKGESIEDWIARQPPGNAEILTRLRTMIHEIAPGVLEQVKWSQPLYGLQKKGMGIASLASHKSHVNLQLSRGAELSDPQGIVEGTGKSMRHVKLRPGEPIPEAALRDLLTAAVRLETGTLRRRPPPAPRRPCTRRCR